MHLEIRVADVSDVCVLDGESLRCVREILSNPNADEGKNEMQARTAALPTGTARNSLSGPSKLSVSFSLERLTAIETREFCSGRDYLHLDKSPGKIVAAKVRKPIVVGEALLLSVPTDAVEYVVKIRLWQHFCSGFQNSGGDAHRAVDAAAMLPDATPHSCKRPSSLCIGIAKVRLPDLLVRSGGCAVSLTAKKAVIDACILANHDFEGTMKYFHELEQLGRSPKRVNDVEMSSAAARRIQTAMLHVVVCAVLFDQMPPETLFCMAPSPPWQAEEVMKGPFVPELAPAVYSPPSVQRLEESARKIAQENGLVISARRHHQRTTSEQSSGSFNNTEGALLDSTSPGSSDFQILVSRISLSSPHTRLLLLPIAVVIDMLVRTLDAFSWRRPRKTLVLLLCFVLVYVAEIVQVALAVGMSLFVIAGCRSALAYSLVDERNPSRDPFLTNSDAVLFSRHCATYNSLVRSRVWMKRGLQAEAFFEVAIVLQLLRQHSTSVQVTLLLFSAAFALLSDLAFFVLVLSTVFLFAPLRLRYGPHLLPLTTAARLREMEQAQSHLVKHDSRSGWKDASPLTSGETAEDTWWSRNRLMWKPSNVFSRPFVVTCVAKVVIDPSVGVTVAAPPALHVTGSSSVLRRRPAGAASSPKLKPKKRKTKDLTADVVEAASAKERMPIATSDRHDESSIASGTAARSDLEGTKAFNPIQIQNALVAPVEIAQQHSPRGSVETGVTRRNSLVAHRAVVTPATAASEGGFLEFSAADIQNVNGEGDQGSIISKSMSVSGLSRNVSSFWPPVEGSGKYAASPKIAPYQAEKQAPAASAEIVMGSPRNRATTFPSGSLTVAPPSQQSLFSASHSTDAALQSSPTTASPTSLAKLHCALIVLTLRDASLGSPAVADASSPITPTTAKAPYLGPFSTHAKPTDRLVYHPGVDLVLTKVLALYRLAECAPTPPVGPPPAAPTTSMFPLHSLSLQSTQSQQQALYQTQLAAYHQQLLQHNQHYFEEAAATLSLLKKQVVQCEALVTPSPPRYEFPSALLYRAESKIKTSCLVECATNDPVTSAMLSVKKNGFLSLGKLPVDSSVDNLIPTRALLSCMLLQGSKMSIFAAKDKPRLSFVVPLAPGNQVIVPPNSPCPPHLANALREAWEGWTEGISADGSVATQPMVDVMSSPEILNTIISQYQGYWRSQLSLPAIIHGPSVSQVGSIATHVPPPASSGEHHAHLHHFHAGTSQAGGLHRADVSFRGRLKSDSASVYHAANMPVPPMISSAMPAGDSVLQQQQSFNLSKQRSLAPSLRHKLGGGPPALPLNTSAVSSVAQGARSLPDDISEENAGAARNSMSPRASMRAPRRQKSIHGHVTSSNAPMAFHFAPVVVSEGEESAQSGAWSRNQAPRSRSPGVAIL